MSVKVKVPGKLPEHEVIDATCRNCGCVFSFLPPDARRIFDQRDGDYHSIPCPTCHADVNVSVMK